MPFSSLALHQTTIRPTKHVDKPFESLQICSDKLLTTVIISSTESTVCRYFFLLTTPFSFSWSVTPLTDTANILASFPFNFPAALRRLDDEGSLWSVTSTTDWKTKGMLKRTHYAKNCLSRIKTKISTVVYNKRWYARGHIYSHNILIFNLKNFNF